MKKLTLLITMLFMLSTTTLYASTLKCTVKKIEANIITMDCGDQAADLAVGTKVKVKTQKAKSSAVEGC